jgi:hypothetical protein
MTKLRYIALVSVMVLATTAETSRRVASASVSSARARQIQAVLAAGLCPSWCTYCAISGDKTISYPTQIYPNNDGYFDCSVGPCEWGNCGDTEEDMLTVLDVATAIVVSTEGSAQEIQGIITLHPTRVLLNEIRSAIQIKGCKGAIVVNIPIDAARFMQLLNLQSALH